MTELLYQLVEHDGGWAHEVDGASSETFPTPKRRIAQQRASMIERLSARSCRFAVP